jgi:hypothetical protein
LFVDRFGNISEDTFDFIYRQSGWDTEAGFPPDEDCAPGTWYTEWFTEEAPEKARYTATLALYFKGQLPRVNIIDESSHGNLPGNSCFELISIRAQLSAATNEQSLERDSRNRSEIANETTGDLGKRHTARKAAGRDTMAAG